MNHKNSDKITFETNERLRSLPVWVLCKRMAKDPSAKLFRLVSRAKLRESQEEYEEYEEMFRQIKREVDYFGY